jgi:hypothetical protein
MKISNYEIWHYVPIILLIFVFSYLNIGCAAVISGTKQKVKINCPVNGVKAKIIYQSEFIYDEVNLPATVEIPRGEKPLMIRINAEGYLPFEQQYETKTNKTTYYNCCFLYFGVIGILVDYIQNSIWEYPEEINCELTPVN